MDMVILSHEPLFPPTGGGSSEAAYLVNEMTSRGHSVRFIGPGHTDVSSEELEKMFGIEHVPFTAWPMGRYTSLRTPKYLLYPWGIKALAQHSFRERPWDVAITQHAISSVAGGWLRKSTNRPLVMNFLDFLTGFMASWPQWKMPAPALKLLNNFEMSMPSRYMADGVMTVSEALRQKFIASGVSAGKIHTMNFGFDSDRFPLREGMASSVDRLSQEVRMVMHGSMDAHHLGPILESAMLSLVKSKNHGPAFRLIFIGKQTPTLTQCVRRLESLAPRLKIECLGFVPYDCIHTELAKADIGLVPYESNPGAHCAFIAKAVEYLACGLPVVSTPLDGIRHFFKDEPVVKFSDFTGVSFGQRILELAGNYPDPLHLKSASQRVHEDLSWQRICYQAVDFIEETTRRHQSTTSRPPGS